MATAFTLCFWVLALATTVATLVSHVTSYRRESRRAEPPANADGSDDPVN